MRRAEWSLTLTNIVERDALIDAIDHDDESMELALDILTPAELEAMAAAAERMAEFARRLAHAKRGHIDA